MKVAYVGGYWATNIGNSFFNLGADYVLKSVFGQDNVNMIFDQPAGIFRSQKKKGNPRNALSLIENYDFDLLVLLGPVISKDFLPIWADTLEKLSAKNKRFMILSCGLMKCSEKDLTVIKSFFLKIPPLLITTRDIDAFESLKGVTNYVYNGFDFAFFVPEIHKPLKLNYQKQLTLNFDKYFEPKIYIDSDKTDKVTFFFEEERWFLKFNEMFKKIGSKTDRFSDAFVYLLSVFPARKRCSSIGKYEIVRTDHRFAPMLKNKVFRYSNSFVSDIPQSYLDIYASSSITLSDRVHACAITLAYGNSAMLFSKTNRSKLLDRVGAYDIHKKPVTIDLDKLEEEKVLLINWIKNSIKDFLIQSNNS